MRERKGKIGGGVRVREGFGRKGGLLEGHGRESSLRPSILTVASFAAHQSADLTDGSSLSPFLPLYLHWFIKAHSRPALSLENLNWWWHEGCCWKWKTRNQAEEVCVATSPTSQLNRNCWPWKTKQKTNKQKQTEVNTLSWGLPSVILFSASTGLFANGWFYHLAEQGVHSLTVILDSQFWLLCF